MKRLLTRIWHWRIGHQWMFVRNIYGDEIIWKGWKRSIYRCYCGAEKWCPELENER